jgi:hypothetical protein
MAKLPIFDVKVFSDGGSAAPKPGDRWVETVWEFETWKQHGQKLGRVRIEANRTTPPGFRATFELKGHDPIEVTGKVPGRGSWKGKGTGRAIGAGRTKDVPFEFRNPKGWG